MGMDSSTTAQHHLQEMGSQTLESILVCSKSSQHQEKKPRPADMESLKCPRCDSINTKFCYYNNYSLSQPRYFCKSCRRYWTKGGTLRNVPVGGGCRKNKRSSSSSSSSPSPSSSSRRTTNPSPNHSNLIPSLTNPLSAYDSNDDLSLAIARLQRQTNYEPMGLGHHEHEFSIWGNPNMPHQGGFAGGGINQNLYYGMGIDGNVNGGMGMGIPYEVKEECETKGVFGFPWQNIGGDQMSEFDSGRLGWNGIGSSSWHGLLNSPLM